MDKYACLWGVFLTDTWCGRSQLLVGGSISGQVVLWYLKKQVERANKHHSFIASALIPSQVPALTSFCDGLWCGSISKINSFCPNLLWAMVLQQQQWKHRAKQGLLWHYHSAQYIFLFLWQFFSRSYAILPVFGSRSYIHFIIDFQFTFLVVYAYALCNFDILK